MKNSQEILISLPAHNSDELEMLKELRNSKEIAHLILNYAKKNSIEDIRNWLISKNLDRGKEGIYVINKMNVNFIKYPIGYLTYNIDSNKPEIATVGICLKRIERGKGHGSKSLNLLIDKLKNDYGIKKITYNALYTNKASRKLFKGYGFKEIRIKKNHFFSLGKWHDVVEGEIIFE